MSDIDNLCTRYLKSRYYERLSPVSKKQYESTINLIISTKLPGFICMGDWGLSHVTRSLVNELFDHISKTRGKVTAARTIRIMSRIFKLALTEWGDEYSMLTKNPFQGFEVDKYEPRETVWTKEQINVFCSVAYSEGYKALSSIAYVCYDLMQRHGDIRKLTKSCVKITQEGKTEVWFTQSKTGQPLWLAPSDTAGKLIRSASADSPTEFVFLNEKTGQPYTQQEITRDFKKVLKAAELPDNLQMRDLRRTAATEAAAAGATEDELMALGGWKSRQIVSVYVQRTKEAAERAQQKRREYTGE